MYSGYRTTIGNSGSWSFDNNTPRNVIIFGVDNSSSSQSDNLKNDFFNIRWVSNFWNNGSFDLPEKKVSINFSKANTKFCSSLHYNANNSYLFANEQEIFKFKIDNKNVLNFQLNFVSDVYLTDLVLLNLEKYLNIKIWMVFPSTTILLINLTF